MRYLLMILVSVMLTSTVYAEKNFEPAYICKAAIATLNGHELTGETELVSKNTYTVKYIRDDGKEFTYWCKLEGSNVRWRDKTMAGWNKNMKLSYQKRNDKLVITADIFGEKDTREF